MNAGEYSSVNNVIVTDKEKRRAQPDGTKICKGCGRKLPLTMYYKQGHTYLPYCKECASIRRHKKYVEHRQEQNEQSKKLHEQKITSRKDVCAICGESRPWVLDFHHVDPSQKDFEISASTSRTEGEIDAEVAKCVCVCSNCHRDFHHQYGKNPKQPKAAWDEYYKLHKRGIA